MGIPENHPAIAQARAKGLIRDEGSPASPPPTLRERKRAAAAVDFAAAVSAAVELPPPPSVNNLFVTRGRRRFKSPAYRDWLAGAVKDLRALGAVRPPVMVRASVCGAVNEARDPDNFWKPILDAAVAAGVIPGDSFRVVRRLELSRGDAGGPPRVVVEFLDVEG